MCFTDNISKYRFYSICYTGLCNVKINIQKCNRTPIFKKMFWFSLFWKFVISPWCWLTENLPLSRLSFKYFIRGGLLFYQNKEQHADLPEIKVFLWSADFLFFLIKILEIKCVKCSPNSSKTRVFGHLFFTSKNFHLCLQIIQ